MVEGDEQSRAQSRRIISRIDAETEARMASHAQQNDPVEIWGKRIGRGLSFVLLAVVLWWLYEAVFAGRTP